MSGKSFCLASLVAAVLGLGTVGGQEPLGQPSPAPYPLTSPAAADPGSGMSNSPAPSPSLAQQPLGAAPSGAPITQGLLPSRWMLYDRSPGCCGPTGANGPIGYEVYLQSGLSVPVGDSLLNKTLGDGWEIQGGARTLFFNPDATAAWTLDVGVNNIYNHVSDQSQEFQLHNITNALTQVTSSPLVTGRDLNRTTVDFALGREWYLLGCAERNGCDTNWRAGFDLGGNYGSAKLEVNGNPHLTDTICGLNFALHSDIEVPWRQWILQFGVRFEYGYTWCDILQDNSNLQNLNFLLTTGVRF